MNKLLQLLLACCFASSAQAQQAPLAVDQPRTQVGAVGNGGELYPFIGLAGDKIELRVDSAVGAGLSVHGPDGALLGSDAGKGARSLPLSLPSDGVYFVAVSVWAKGQYTIELKRVFTATPARLGPPPVDPVWGLYARLPGQKRVEQARGSAASATQSWRWEREGEVLLEEWHASKNPGKLVFSARITRGPAPGELLLSGDSMGNKQWAGQVASDGSVTWVGVKGMKLPYRVVLLDDERMRVEYLDKSGGVRYSLWFLPADNGGLLPLAPTRRADPSVWGVYSRLVGASVSGPLNIAYNWSWGEGETIAQDSPLWGRSLIQPAGPGRLRMTPAQGAPLDGVLESPDAVLWTRPGKTQGARYAIRNGEAVYEDVRVARDGSIETLATYRLKGQLQPPPMAMSVNPPQPQPTLVPQPQPQPQPVPVPVPVPVPQPKPVPKPVTVPVVRPADAPRSDAATIKARGIQNVVWRFCFTQAMGVKQFYWTDVFPADMFKRDQSAEAFRVYLRAHGMPYLGVNCGDQPDGRAQAEASRQREMVERAAKGFPSVETHWSEGE